MSVIDIFIKFCKKKSFLVMIKATNILFGQFGMYIYVYEWSFKDD